LQGSDSASKIVILVDRARASAQFPNPVIDGWDLFLIEEKAKRAGLDPGVLGFASCADAAGDLPLWLKQFFPNAEICIPLDGTALRAVTGLHDIRKWHLSPLAALSEFHFRKVLPSFHPESIRREYPLSLYLEMTLVKAEAELRTPGAVFRNKPKRFFFSPPLAETFAILDSLVDKPWLSVDLETGRGQINTVGFAWSESDAIAVNVLPERCSADQYAVLWEKIRRLCEGPALKLAQNGIYETLYLSKYGIRLTNLVHDCMWAMKFLWPELEKGLDNVGRLYTTEPYWKDVGKVHGTEGKTKDWGNVRDWHRHYLYNCLDTANSFEAAMNQMADLRERGQYDLFYNFIMRFMPPLQEMCLRGLPVCPETHARLISEYEGKVAELTASLSKPINPRSAKQKLELFKSKGYAIPKSSKKNAKSGERESKESTDELALKKLRLKHPQDTDLISLIEIIEYQGALSKYFYATLDSDNHARFMLDGVATETGRWSSSLDPWGGGFNAQTVPGYMKKAIRWSAHSE